MTAGCIERSEKAAVRSGCDEFLNTVCKVVTDQTGTQTASDADYPQAKNNNKCLTLALLKYITFIIVIKKCSKKSTKKWLQLYHGFTTNFRGFGFTEIFTPGSQKQLVEAK